MGEPVWVHTCPTDSPAGMVTSAGEAGHAHHVAAGEAHGHGAHGASQSASPEQHASHGHSHGASHDQSHAQQNPAQDSPHDTHGCTCIGTCACAAAPTSPCGIIAHIPVPAAVARVAPIASEITAAGLPLPANVRLPWPTAPPQGA